MSSDPDQATFRLLLRAPPPGRRQLRRQPHRFHLRPLRPLLPLHPRSPMGDLPAAEARVDPRRVEGQPVPNPSPRVPPPPGPAAGVNRLLRVLHPAPHRAPPGEVRVLAPPAPGPSPRLPSPTGITGGIRMPGSGSANSRGIASIGPPRVCIRTRRIRGTARGKLEPPRKPASWRACAWPRAMDTLVSEPHPSLPSANPRARRTSSTSRMR